MKSFIVSMIIIMSCALIAYSQSTSERKFKHKDKIVTTYDKSRNLTTVFLKSDVNNSFSGGTDSVSVIGLLAGFSYQGTDMTENPKGIEFVLEITRSKSRSDNTNIPDLIAELDGTKLNLGKPKLIGAKVEDISQENLRISLLMEKIGILLPLDVFQKITSAKAVKLQSGNVKLTLKEKHLEALRDLGSRIN